MLESCLRATPMVRLELVALRRDQRALLHRLGQLRTVHLTPLAPAALPLGTPDAGYPPASARAPAPDSGSDSHLDSNWDPDLAPCDRLLARVHDLRGQLGIPVDAKTPDLRPSPPPDSPVTDLASADACLRAWESRAAALVSRSADLTRQITAWEQILMGADRFGRLPIPDQGLGRARFLQILIGTLPDTRIEAVARDLGESAVLLPADRQEGRRAAMVLCARHHRDHVEACLAQAGFRADAPEGFAEASPERLGREAARQQTELRLAVARVEEERRQLARASARPLRRVERWATRERTLRQTAPWLPQTQSTFAMAAWIPAADREGVESALRELTHGHCWLRFADPEGIPDEQVPVRLRSPSWLRPFQALVEAYGLPGYRELAPTLFVALSYPLMLGMMFGDVGHGALLALAGATLRARAATRAMRDLGVLLGFAGLSSLGFGWVYGSCFGLESWKPRALWHDPIDADPLALIQAALGLGVAMIALGLTLNIINRVVQGDLAGAFLGRFGVAGILVYGGAVAWLAAPDFFRDLALPSWVPASFVGIGVLSWIAAEPLRHPKHSRGTSSHPIDSPGAVLAESVVGAFEALLLYLANTVSFVRLAAYALSHAALLMATFSVAAELRNLNSPVGHGLALLTIVAGNAVTFVLEGLVASIQALRLEYYEFFGKFFSGAGLPFRAFQLEDPDDPAPVIPIPSQPAPCEVPP